MSLTFRHKVVFQKCTLGFEENGCKRRLDLFGSTDIFFSLYSYCGLENLKNLHREFSIFLVLNFFGFSILQKNII